MVESQIEKSAAVEDCTTAPARGRLPSKDCKDCPSFPSGMNALRNSRNNHWLWTSVTAKFAELRIGGRCRLVLNCGRDVCKVKAVIGRLGGIKDRDKASQQPDSSSSQEGCSREAVSFGREW